MYAEALRAEGFECVVTGGSLFASAPEVRVVARFVEALANPANTAALFEVLTSDMMRLSADDLLVLTTEEDPETGCVRRRDLDRGFARLASRADGLPPRLAHAVRLFERARDESRTRPVATVVRDAVVRSGWMARLEEEGAAGTARAANVLKAVRLVDRLETERHLGLASTARALADELAVGLKEAPGALSGAGGDVVKIMTIHASKGLEFPVVALADFADARAGSGKLLVETCGAIARASLAPAASLEAFPQLAKRSGAAAAGDGEDDADLLAARRLVEGEDGPACALGASSCTQAAYRAQLARRAADEELAEARRKLYVGLTRASEALVVAMDAKAPSAGKPPAYAPLVDDIRSALCGDGDFPEGVAELPYGGTAPARFERILVQPPEPRVEEGAEPAPEPRLFFVPVVDDASRSTLFAGGSARDDAFSYSSIAPNPVPAPAGEGAPFAADADKATDLGSAFHRAAQLAVETGRVPDAARLGVLSEAYALSTGQRARLADACERWFSSATYAETLQWGLRRAEVPFFVPISDAFVEGEIDLLCTDDAQLAGARALVVDYKTGGSDGEAPEALCSKHLLQAQCYAYALLRQGCVEVELRFARVEREDSAGDMQTVTYRFTAEDLDGLAVRILSARRA